MTRKRIVVMGFMGSCPIAGVVWQHLHYLVGLQQLGHEVYYIEDSARYPYNPETWETLPDFTYAARRLQTLAEEFGFAGRWSFCARYHHPPQTAGLPLARLRELYREADAILNICGAQEMNEDLLQSTRLIYVESDPGLEQIRIDQGDAETLVEMRQHCALFTFGENIGTPHFPVPLHGFTWHPTRQPVVTDLWRTHTLPAPEARFSTVANWNTSGRKDITWRGETYLWSKSLEFLKFIRTPELAGEPFALASNVRDDPTRALFTQHHWELLEVDPISNHHQPYRSFLQGSKGEFTAAKDQYVRLHTGWFSDRSACYLAAGRPVITQETGFTRLYGGERGLLAFRTEAEAVEAVRAVNRDYAAHARAAYEIAREHFEATTVLRALLQAAGV